MVFDSIPCTTLLYWATIIVLGGASLLLMGIRLYAYLTSGVCKSEKQMDGKTVIITGCTSGIGKETARNLAKRGARVIMACRSVDAANRLKGFLVNMIILMKHC